VGSKNNTDLWILASDYDAGFYFEFLICRSHLLKIFLAPVSTAKLMGGSYNKKQSAVKGVCVLPILWFSLCCANTILAILGFWHFLSEFAKLHLQVPLQVM
jgi:hypothetical protein